MCEEVAIWWGILHVWGSSYLVRNIACVRKQLFGEECCSHASQDTWCMTVCVRKTSWSVFIFTNFNAVVLTCCVRFWWIRTWPNGWQFIFPHCHAIELITLSSVRFFLSLCEADYFPVLWSVIPSQSLNVYYAFKKCVLLLNSWVLCFQRLHYTFIAGVSVFCVQCGFWYLWLQCFRMLSVPVIQGTFWPCCVWMEQF